MASTARPLDRSRYPNVSDEDFDRLQMGEMNAQEEAALIRQATGYGMGTSTFADRPGGAMSPPPVNGAMEGRGRNQYAEMNRNAGRVGFTPSGPVGLPEPKALDLSDPTIIHPAPAAAVPPSRHFSGQTAPAPAPAAAGPDATTDPASYQRYLEKEDQALLRAALATPHGSNERFNLAEQRIGVRGQLGDIRKANAPVVDQNAALAGRAKAAGFTLPDDTPDDPSDNPANVKGYLDHQQAALHKRTVEGVGAQANEASARVRAAEGPLTDEEYALRAKAHGFPGAGENAAYAGKLKYAGEVAENRIGELRSAKESEADVLARLSDLTREVPQGVDADAVARSNQARTMAADAARRGAQASVAVGTENYGAAVKAARADREIAAANKEAERVTAEQLADPTFIASDIKSQQETRRNQSEAELNRSRAGALESSYGIDQTRRQLETAVQNNDTDTIDRAVPYLAREMGRTIGLAPNLESMNTVRKTLGTLRTAMARLPQNQRSRYLTEILRQPGIGDFSPSWLDRNLNWPGAAAFYQEVKTALDEMRAGTFGELRS